MNMKDFLVILVSGFFVTSNTYEYAKCYAPVVCSTYNKDADPTWMQVIPPILNKVTEQQCATKNCEFNFTSAKVQVAVMKMIPKDCTNVEQKFAKSWNETGGVFDIYPENFVERVEVYCDVTTDGGGWIIIQRRVDGSVDFYRNWTEYVDGFGDVNNNFWMGLEKIHQLTSDGNHELRVDMADWEGNTAYAKYSTFSVGDAASKYRLTVEGYSGTAGDSLTYHNGKNFNTKDSNVNSCATSFRSGWWYGNCYYANLNGIYKSTGKYTGSIDGIVWFYLKNTYSYSLKWVEMKFRPSA